jgi:hypothetical protein
VERKLTKLKLDVVNLVEQPDGSAIVTFDMDETTKQYLIGYAVLDILRKAAETALTDEIPLEDIMDSIEAENH